ncbi:MAG: energy transducer TonB [Flavobacterium sp.]|nr:energy transducer TonB [Flavobacterium sp.]
MTDFLITSNIALFVLLAIYHVLLEREKMHTFNRFYLLGAVVLSLLIPFLTFEIISQVPATIMPELIQPTMTATLVAESRASFPYHQVFWAIYALVTIALLMRFLKNLSAFATRENKSEIIDCEKSKIVLVDNDILPHTFWNRIYVNATDYKSGKITKELLDHEMVHVKQKHSVDIIFIELLKVIFWFNPIFIFYKRAIQLNHEFLADSAVVEKYNVVEYQNLLLKTASAHSYSLASSLNYQLTKKRLIMMTKTASKRRILLKKAILLPVLAALIYSSCTKVVAQQTPMTTSDQQYDTRNEQISRDAYYKNVHVIVKNMDDNKIVIDKSYEKLSTSEKDRYIQPAPAPYQKKELSSQHFNSYKNTNEFAIWIDSRHVSNTVLKHHKPSDFALATQSFVHKNARSKKFFQPNQVQLYTHEYFDKTLKNQHKKYPGDTLKIFHTAKIKKEQLAEVNAAIEKNSHNTAQKLREEEIEEYVEETQTDVRNTTEIDKKPDFPGGIAEFYKFVSANYNLPDSFKGAGRIIVMFIIEKDGSISNSEVIRDAGEGTGPEALRVMQLAPKWIPGEDKGEPVRVLYSLPISIVK